MAYQLPTSAFSFFPSGQFKVDHGKKLPRERKFGWVAGHPSGTGTPEGWQGRDHWRTGRATDTALGRLCLYRHSSAETQTPGHAAAVAQPGVPAFNFLEPE